MEIYIWIGVCLTMFDYAFHNNSDMSWVRFGFYLGASVLLWPLSILRGLYDKW